MVEGVYQDAPDDQPGNALLEVMGESLSQVAASGAPSLATEIEFWLQARDLAAEGQDEPAVTLFDRVLQQSLDISVTSFFLRKKPLLLKSIL